MNAFDISTISIETLRKNILLEASAGTGKTYNLERMVIRLLGETDLSLDQVLVVTFTNDATREVKNRVRRLLNEYSQLPEKTEEERRRYQKAYSSFSQAPIFTIHGFCQYLLSTFPFESGYSFNNEVGQLPLFYSQVVRNTIRQEGHRIWGDNKNTEEAHNIEQFCWQFILSNETLSQWEERCTDDLQKIVEPLEGVLEYEPSREDIDKHIYDLYARQPSIQDAITTWVEDTWWQEQDIDSLVGEFKKLGIKAQTGKSLAKNLLALHEQLARESWMFVLSNQDSKTLERLHSFYLILEEENRGSDSPFFLFKQVVESFAFFWPSNKTEWDQHVKALVEAWLYFHWTVDLVSPRLKIAYQEQSTLSFNELIRAIYRLVILEPNQAFIAAIQRQFKVVIIDEFQDTDSLQWQIFHRLFEGSQKEFSQRNYILIGDPKQSIYRFRGSDLSVFFEAKKNCSDLFLLDTCYRSERNLVTAYNQVFEAVFTAKKENDLEYKAVAANDESIEILKDNSDKEREQANIHFLWNEFSGEKFEKDFYFQRVAQEIETLLSQKNVCLTKGTSSRFLEPRDIAILIRANSDSLMLQKELSRRSISAVNFAQESIWSSDALDLLILLLLCWEKPYSMSSIRDLLLSPLCDCSLEDTQEYLNGNEWQNLQQMLVKTQTLILEKGNLLLAFKQLDSFVFKGIGKSEEPLQLGQRLLAQEQGERLYVDLWQLLEILQSRLEKKQYSLAELRYSALSLQKRNEDSTSEESIRLDKDENAVKIMTLHKSKGLEFPIVFIVAGFSGDSNKNNKPFFYNEKNRLTLGITGTPEAQEKATILDWEETKRLLYVGFTRAKNRLYLPAYASLKLGNGNIAISQLYTFYGLWLSHYIPSIANKNKQVSKPLFLEWKGRFFEENIQAYINEINDYLHNEEQGLFCLREAESSELHLRHQKNTETLTLEAPQLRDSVSEQVLKRQPNYSFTSLSHQPEIEHLLAEQKAFSAPEYDENKALLNNTVTQNAIGLLPKGATFGSMIHDLLEVVDYAFYAWTIEENPHIKEESAWSLEQKELAYQIIKRYYSEFWTQQNYATIYELLHNVVNREILGGWYLRDMTTENRRHEKEFLYRVRPKAHLSFAGKDLRQLSDGYLLGFIDVIIQWQDKWYIIDWKTNSLGDQGPDAYTSSAIQTMMLENKYEEQGRLYLLSVYLYLCDYMSPSEAYDRIGGCYYLFVRGLQPSKDTGVYSVEITHEELQKMTQSWGLSN